MARNDTSISQENEETIIMKDKKKGHLIRAVEPGSIAEELELASNDRLISINDQEIDDVFDYRYLLEDTVLQVLIEKESGELWELEIEKDEDEDLGIVFESGLMDDYRSCRNNCIFCFVDQMPPGMRETLYFKDDDSRLSFLQGNYVTLTNMSDKDLDRIIRYRMEPINISIHTTNPQLRCQMLNNRFAGEALKKLERLYEAGIEMNGQIVLCKGYNDGEELDQTIKELSRYLPHMRSVSVVPVGLTKYRDGLSQLEAFTGEDARKVLDQIHGWQRKFYEEHGNHFIHAGDEWYILAGEEFPPAENYDGYLQLENGVGMVRLLMDEVEEELKALSGDDREARLSIATGELAYPYLVELTKQVSGKFPGIHVEVYPVSNRFFGGYITVAGLLTGRDLAEGLAGKDLGERLLLPSVMFRNGEEVFLDDMTLQELSETLQVPITIVQSSGADFVQSMIHAL